MIENEGPKTFESAEDLDVKTKFTGATHEEPWNPSNVNKLNPLESSYAVKAIAKKLHAFEGIQEGEKVITRDSNLYENNGNVYMQMYTSGIAADQGNAVFGKLMSSGAVVPTAISNGQDGENEPYFVEAGGVTGQTFKIKDPELAEFAYTIGKEAAKVHTDRFNDEWDRMMKEVVAPDKIPPFKEFKP